MIGAEKEAAITRPGVARASNMSLINGGSKFSGQVSLIMFQKVRPKIVSIDYSTSVKASVIEAAMLLAAQIEFPSVNVARIFAKVLDLYKLRTGSVLSP